MNDLMDNIKNLRKITSAGFLDCKKALEANNNDIENSINFLRKNGLTKANKKSSREVNEGAVGIYSNNDMSIIMQINTETDFVARNNIFLDFMDEIGNFYISFNNIELSIKDFNSKLFNERTINDRFKDIIATLGENIVLSKLIAVKKSDNSLISSYIHNSYRKNIGKIAVNLKLNIEKINEEAAIFGKNLCMHIAASKPLALNIDDLDEDMVVKEKEILKESIKNNGKSNDIVEKILIGKMKKFYSEFTLMNQKFIMDSEKTIEEIILEFSKKNKTSIVEYNLFVIES